MREEVIVQVKREVHSDDEEENLIDPSSSMSQSTSNGITAEISTSNAELSLEGESPSACSDPPHHWPCAVCGRLFDQREQVLEHVKNEHAEQMINEMVGRMDEGLRAKLAAIQQQQRLLALLQNGQAAAGLLQQPAAAAAAAMLQLLGMAGGGVKETMPQLVPFPPMRTAMATMRAESAENGGSESRRAFPGRPRHPVWSLFNRIDKFDAECNLCKSRVRSACPTNLCRHLNNNHCELASQLFVKWKKQKEDLGGSFPPLEPRAANRHKSSSTSSTSSSTSSGSAPVAAAAAAAQVAAPAAAPPPPAAPSVAPLMTPIVPGFPHLPLIVQQQHQLLQQREHAAVMAPEMLKAIDAQLLLNFRIISAAQAALERSSAPSAAAAACSQSHEAEPGPSRVGVIQFGGADGVEHSVECDGFAAETPIDVLSFSPHPDDLDQSAAAATVRPSSAPPPSSCCSRPPSPAARAASSAPMMALMDGGGAAHEMYGYQQPQPSGLVLQGSQQQGETAAALRQPPTQQTLESWFATAYAQPVQLEATTVMNAASYGTLAQSTDAATVPETANFTTDIKNVPLFTEEQQHLFAASSSGLDPQQQLQLFQSVKQEMSMDDTGEEGSSSSQQQLSSSLSSLFPSTPSTACSLINSFFPGQPPAKRGRPTENPCWEYFDRLDDTLVKCRTCEKVVKSACATNMTKHLERHHQGEYTTLLGKIRISRQFKPTPVPPSSLSLAASASSLPLAASASSLPSTSDTIQQQFGTTAMALNQMAHQPQHHLLQPMSADLGQQLGHHLPLSPDPSPAAAHCILTTHHHFLKDPSSIRPEMLLIPTSDGLIPNLDPNSYHVPSDFYGTMQFDNSSLFDGASQWQQRHFPPYDQWMAANDQSSSAMLMADDWNQSAAAAAAASAAAAAAAQQQAQLEQQLQLQQQSSVIQSVVAGATTSGGAESVGVDVAALAAAVAASDASSTSSTSSSSCGGTTAGGSLSALMRPHETKPYMKRNRKTEHPVWEFFKRTADGNAQCSICSGIVKSPCSSNFMRHLMRHHSAEYNAVYAKWSQKRGPPSLKSASASF